MDPPNLRPEIVKLVIKGIEHKEAEKNRNGRSDNRTPKTRDLMKILKDRIIAWEQPWNTRLLVWAVSTMAFHGAFRIHELLCKAESFFDPQYTLLTENVTTSTDTTGKRIIHMKLNCPKEQKNGHAVIVDIFESGDSICPVKAFTRWTDRQRPTAGLPLFRQTDGTPLTGKKLNTILDLLMKDVAVAKNGKIKTHSFRIGMASELGTEGFRGRRGQGCREMELSGFRELHSNTKENMFYKWLIIINIFAAFPSIFKFKYFPIIC
jgi:hypothetical protein